MIMETILIILITLISFYTGYTIAKGIDNNHRELFQAYMDEQIKLTQEKHYHESEKIYYENLYLEIIKNLKETENIEDYIRNPKGDIIGVIYKE